jgi:zinc/manganese transport system permease protein
MRTISAAFMMVVALCGAACAEVTGLLLVFSLLVGPAATMVRLGLAPPLGLALSGGLAVALAWAGLALAWWTDAPVSFWIGLLAAAAYLASCVRPRRASSASSSREDTPRAGHAG